MLTQIIAKPPHPRFRDIEGFTFGQWTVEGYCGVSNNHQWWKVKCSCGTISYVIAANLISGKSKTCRQCLDKKTSLRKRTHGYSSTSIYRIWFQIKDRCNNPRNHAFNHYGERGIRVCARWTNSFEDFLSDMGERPAKKSIDRIDNDAHYSCGKCAECIRHGWTSNCKWATQTEQTNNQSRNHYVTFQGRTQSLSLWCKELGLNRGHISQRLRKLHWTPERALTTPKLKLRTKPLQVTSLCTVCG